MELVDIKAKTRGKNTREVSYKGIGTFVPETSTVDGKEVTTNRLVVEGAITDIKDALSLVGGNMQTLLDNFAVGYNLEAYKAASDVLAEYIKPSWSTAQVAAFRLAVNNLVKLPNVTLESAVAFASNTLPA